MERQVEPPPTKQSPRATRRGALPLFVLFLAVVSLGAGVELYALWRSNHQQGALPAPAASTETAPKLAAASPLPPIVGWVDEPVSESTVADRLVTSGWALGAVGMKGVDIIVDGERHAASYGSSRPDVAAHEPRYPNGTASGFTFSGDFADRPPVRHLVEYVGVDAAGNTKSFARKSLIPPRALAMWRPLLDELPSLAREPFWVLMMMSAINTGAAAEVDTRYKEYESRTMRVGMAVPILYLRTTRGRSGDWVFDPAFDTTRKCEKRPVAEDNLGTVIEYAERKRVPVQFILNGGIWADSSCETPEWDLTDHLEEDPANCQWTQSNEVFPDNYLKGLAGSLDSPELARSLTYHVYAKNIRAYKKRNLQAAARIIAKFARKHPDLFVGVVLDSDTYMNPFFYQRQIFDYNPGMIRQFRDWLRGTGVYAGDGGDAAPDLRRYRRAHPLTLAEVNRISRRQFKSWSEVDPPRRLPGSPRDELKPGETPFWDDPWWQEWDQFRKHVVGLHYDELSQWVHEAGIPGDRIFSAQGFIRSDAGLKPFAIRIDSHTQNYDSAGVSVEGAIPRFGHLGAVIYGEAARNEVPMEWRHTMFATFGRMDDGWAIVEYNSTDLKRPKDPPGYGVAYKTFRDAFNLGASEISAMAWNGGNGNNTGAPGYVPYTTWRNTQPEEAMMDFMVAHADVPKGSRLWTFGTPRHADDDGWSVSLGSMKRGEGFLTMQPDAGHVTLISPGDQLIRPRTIERLVMRWADEAHPVQVRVYAQVEPDAPWQEVGESTGGQVVFKWPPQWLRGGTIVERLMIKLAFASDARAVTLSRVLLYPRAPDH